VITRFPIEQHTTVGYAIRAAISGTLIERNGAVCVSGFSIRLRFKTIICQDRLGTNARSKLRDKTVAASFLSIVQNTGLATLFLAFRMPETLPHSKRRPFRLRDVNPFAFLRLFRSSTPSTLRR
jgi:hypothetical protein